MATANSKLKIDYGFDSYGTSNVTGDFRVSGNVFIQGTILSSIRADGDFIPNSLGLQLGNTTNRWTVLANSGNFSNTLTVAGAGSFQDELTVTKTINASNNVVITGFANATVSVNSALLTVGSNFIANVTGAYHTGTVNAASHTIGTSFIANSTAIVGTGYANVTTSVNSALLTVGTNFIANVTGAYHTGTVNAASHTTTGFVANTTAIVPTSNTILLGNTVGRFVLSANTGDFSGTVTGTVANMSTSVNSALLTVGSSFIANATGAYHTGVINAASHTTTGFVANTTAIVPTSNTILLGNTLGRFVISANTADLSGQLTVSGNTTLTGNATLNGTVHAIAGNSNFDSGVFFVDGYNNRVGVNNTAPTVAFEVSGAANVSASVNSALFTVGANLIANATGVYHTGTVNAASLTTTNFIANTSGTYPLSNTAGTSLGATTQRWVINANTINASGLITGTAGATITGQSNLVDVTVSGNLTVSGTTTFINTTTLNVGDNIVTLNADLGAVAPSENAGLEINRGNSANVNFLWNESAQSWTAGNTSITGYANASVSVNSALLTVGSNFIANVTGAYHTGTVNAASHTTTGFVANTTAIVPTSNTILLGNTIGRFVISANTADFSGTVTGTVANMSTSVNSALLTVGSIFIANATGAYHTGVINAASHTIGANLIANTLGVYHTGIVNAASHSTSGFVANTTAIAPTSNTILLGNTIGRFVISANTIDASGTVNAASHTVGTSFVANSSMVITPQVVIPGGGATSEGGQIVIGYGNNLAASITGQANNTFNLDITGGNTASTPILRAFFQNADSTITNAFGIANTGKMHIGAITENTDSTLKVTGSANVSTSVNSAVFTIGTSFIANTTGTYHTNLVNSASYTIGANLVANTLGVYHTGIINAASISVGSGSFIANATAVVISDPLTANGTTGTSGQFLVSNGAAGSPYWSSGYATSVADDISTDGSRYLLFANQTSSSLSTAYVSSTKLSYNPSTGTLSSTVMTGSSDERLKTNIETIIDPIGTLSQLRGVSFNRIDNNHKDYGVIAQEIEKILPDVVYTDASGFKTVSYNSVIGFLIEAVKKQQDQINILMQDKYPK